MVVNRRLSAWRTAALLVLAMVLCVGAWGASISTDFSDDTLTTLTLLDSWWTYCPVYATADGFMELMNWDDPFTGTGIHVAGGELVFPTGSSDYQGGYAIVASAGNALGTWPGPPSGAIVDPIVGDFTCEFTVTNVDQLTSTGWALDNLSFAGTAYHINGAYQYTGMSAGNPVYYTSTTLGVWYVHNHDWVDVGGDRFTTVPANTSQIRFVSELVSGTPTTSTTLTTSVDFFDGSGLQVIDVAAIADIEGSPPMTASIYPYGRVFDVNWVAVPEAYTTMDDFVLTRSDLDVWPQPELDFGQADFGAGMVSVSKDLTLTNNMSSAISSWSSDFSVSTAVTSTSLGTEQFWGSYDLYESADGMQIMNWQPTPGIHVAGGELVFPSGTAAWYDYQQGFTFPPIPGNGSTVPLKIPPGPDRVQPLVGDYTWEFTITNVDQLTSYGLWGLDNLAFVGCYYEDGDSGRWMGMTAGDDGIYGATSTSLGTWYVHNHNWVALTGDEFTTIPANTSKIRFVLEQVGQVATTSVDFFGGSGLQVIDVETLVNPPSLTIMQPYSRVFDAGWVDVPAAYTTMDDMSLTGDSGPVAANLSLSGADAAEFSLALPSVLAGGDFGPGSDADWTLGVLDSNGQPTTFTFNYTGTGPAAGEGPCLRIQCGPALTTNTLTYCVAYQAVDLEAGKTYHLDGAWKTLIDSGDYGYALQVFMGDFGPGSDADWTLGVLDSNGQPTTFTFNYTGTGPAAGEGPCLRIQCGPALTTNTLTYCVAYQAVDLEAGKTYHLDGAWKTLIDSGDYGYALQVFMGDAPPPAPAPGGWWPDTDLYVEKNTWSTAAWGHERDHDYNFDDTFGFGDGANGPTRLTVTVPSTGTYYLGMVPGVWASTTTYTMDLVVDSVRLREVTGATAGLFLEPGETTEMGVIWDTERSSGDVEAEIAVGHTAATPATPVVVTIGGTAVPVTLSSFILE